MKADVRPETALFGGSFDPPHVGHVKIVKHALEDLGIDRVLVVPVFAHAFEKPLSRFEHRLRMTELAFAEEPRAQVLDIEKELEVPSRTLRTIEALTRRDPRLHLRLLVGADVLAETAKWHAWDEIVRRAPPLIVGRVGAERMDAPAAVIPDISSTRLRSLLSAALPDRDRAAELRQWLPPRVLEYIEEHHLYR